MTPELLALITYIIDRAIELFSKKDMTIDDIKADVINQISTYQTIKAQIDEEMARYQGDSNG